MYEEHEDIDTPGDEVVIWRYMSIDKYIHLLDTSLLYMCRADKFEDPWEAVWPDGYFGAIPDEMQTFLYKQRGFIFVNCWHENTYESAAMWDLYGTRHSGIAIKTTVGSLKRAIHGEHRLYIGRVEYIDYSAHVPKALANDFTPGLLKRHSFSHEKEIRILSVNTSGSVKRENPGGSWYMEPGLAHMTCKVDLSCLLEEVFFSPSMPGWLSDALINVSSKYDVRTKFRKSNLYDAKVR